MTGLRGQERWKYQKRGMLARDTDKVVDTSNVKLRITIKRQKEALFLDHLGDPPLSSIGCAIPYNGIAWLL
ncbi:hypothetical protein N7501_008026 [Penicillium viridicatum]|nr:hypothetical protein N7501_008026 [Penicillium viridicatum]